MVGEEQCWCGDIMPLLFVLPQAQRQADIFFQAERVVRTRSLQLTHLEVANLRAKFKNEKELVMVQRAAKVVKDSGPLIKLAIQRMFNENPDGYQFEKGAMCMIDSQEWSLCKALLAAWLNSKPQMSDQDKANPCMCLPVTALMPAGCVRQKDAYLWTPKVPFTRFLCHQCTICYRCGGFLVCAHDHARV